MSERTPDSPTPPTPSESSKLGRSALDNSRNAYGFGEDASELVGERLGPFEVREVIGRGGMGVVLAGRHIHQRVPVAIKVITGADPSDRRLRRRLRNEVQAVAGLNHPGIVRVFDHGEIERTTPARADSFAGSPYYVMELTRRGTLREITGRLTWLQVKALLLTVLDALAHAHAAGVIHRDIKPENILLGSRSGRIIPKLADFGISFAFEGDASAAHCIGTPRYMAPEQINQPWRTHGPWSDLYSLGCVAYEVLCGRELFAGQNLVDIYQEHFRVNHPPIDPVVTVPPGVQGWLDKMLRRDISERFQTAADAARALIDLDDEGLPDTRPPQAVDEEVARRTPVLDPLLDCEAAGTMTPAEKQRCGALERLPDRWPAPEVEPTPIQIVGTGLGLYGLRTIPLIGRERELELLWQTLREVDRNKETHVVMLQGPQGCGKTRLVECFTRRLREFGAATILEGTHTAEGSSSEGMSLMLERHFRTVGADERDTENVLRLAMGEADFDVPYDWHVMMRMVRPELDEGLQGAGFQIATPAQRYAVLRRYLRQLAEHQPVVVWLDDVQWGSDAIEFARFVRRIQPDDTGPVLLVMTLTEDALAERPDERELLDELAAMNRVARLDVAPLEAVQQERLVEELLLLEGDLAREVVQRSAGNPLFAVELIGDWVQRGVLEVGERGFVLGDGVNPVIPDHLHDVWVQRIEALLADFSADARRALELAAALGQHVRTDEWRGVCDLAGLGLDETLAAELIERRFAQHTERGWAFSHPIIRESIERIARDEGRWIAHRRKCAILIETLYDITNPRIAERFGSYAMSACEFGRALEPLLNGARGRRHRGEYRDAQQVLSSYLMCLERMGAAEDDRRWGDGWILRARIYLNTRQPREARRWAQMALTAAERHGWVELRAQAMGWLALARQWMGEPDAADLLRQSRRLLDEIQAPHDMCGVFASVAHGLSRLGEFDHAWHLLERDLEAAQANQDWRAVADNHYLRCRHAFFRRDWDEALQSAQEALDQFRTLGHLPGECGCLEATAEIYRLNGDVERAEDIYRQCLEMGAKIGSPAAIARLNLANILLHRQRPAEAERLFMMAATAFGAAGRRTFHAVSLAGLLACAADQELWTGVAEHLPEVAEFVEETDACEHDLAELLEFAGDRLRDGGQFRDAIAVYTLAVQQWQRLGEDERVDTLIEMISRWT